MDKLDNIKNILNDEGIDLEPYRSSDDDRIRKWIIKIEYYKNKPSRRLSYYNQIKVRHSSFSKWFCAVCNHQSNSARGFKYHIESQPHKIKCGKITSIVCEFCGEEIKEGTLGEHIRKSPFCKKAQIRKEKLVYIKKQSERDEELYKMDVNDPDIWFDELKDEYNRRLTAVDGVYRNDDIILQKNHLGLLVPITKLKNFDKEKLFGIFSDEIKEKKEEDIDYDAIDLTDTSTMTYDELDELLATYLINPLQYRRLLFKKKKEEQEYQKAIPLINKINEND